MTKRSEYKHDKVDQKVLQLVKWLKVVAKCYLIWIFFMMPSTFVLSTQIENKCDIFKITIKSNAQ